LDLWVALLVAWVGGEEAWERADFGAELAALCVVAAAPGALPDPFPDFSAGGAACVVELLRRRVEEVRTGAGSATRRRRPASTRVPEGMLFQRRSWLKETPKRSAMVTRVSPRRTV
jgi:hypothetical protein